MPSRFNLSYGVTSILMNQIREGFQQDKDLYYTGSTTQRINTPQVLDGWGYVIKEYPSIIVSSTPGQNRRMGIGDYAAVPYFGVSAAEDQSVSAADYRKFVVSGILPVGTPIDVTYTPASPSDPVPSPTTWTVEVQAGALLPAVRFIELTGADIGPYTAFPAANFSMISKTATADQYGGFFDLKADIYVITLGQTEREIVTDKLWSMLWFTKKRELLMKGVVILDVSYTGNTQEDYGADKLYIARMTVSCATEFRQLVYYLDTVEGITVHGEIQVPLS